MSAELFMQNNLPKETKIAKNAHQLYNQKQGHLTILYPYRKLNNSGIFWVCKCSCGNYCGISSKQLTKSKNPTQSCGCLRIKVIRSKYQIVKEGMQIASLTTIKQFENRQWLVECNWCKKQYYVSSGYLNKLINDNIKECSCGCQKGRFISDSKIKDLTGKRFGDIQVLNFSGIINQHNAIWNCQCNCGNVFLCSSTELVHKQKTSCGCKRQNISKDAQKILNFLKQNEYSFVSEYKFQDLEGDKGRPLRFDFALLSNSNVILLIEIQGRQHYMPVDIFGGQESFDIQQRYDNKKREYCKNNKIPLLELTYKEIPEMTIEIFNQRVRELLCQKE